MRPPNAKRRPGRGGAAMVIGNGNAADHIANASLPQVPALAALRATVWRMSLLAGMLGAWTGAVAMWAFMLARMGRGR
jgi:hypothetical protein